MSEIARVREEILKLIKSVVEDDYECELTTYHILSIKVKGKTIEEWMGLLEQGKLVELDDDQRLPSALYHEGEKLEPKWVEEVVKNDMRQAGWIKKAGEK